MNPKPGEQQACDKSTDAAGEQKPGLAIPGLWQYQAQCQAAQAYYACAGEPSPSHLQRACGQNFKEIEFGERFFVVIFQDTDAKLLQVDVLTDLQARQTLLKHLGDHMRRRQILRPAARGSHAIGRQ